MYRPSSDGPRVAIPPTPRSSATPRPTSSCPTPAAARDRCATNERRAPSSSSPAGKVFYRKVAPRRAYSDELLDALDYHAGTYRPKP